MQSRISNFNWRASFSSQPVLVSRITFEFPDATPAEVIDTEVADFTKVIITRLDSACSHGAHSVTPEEIKLVIDSEPDWFRLLSVEDRVAIRKAKIGPVETQEEWAKRMADQMDKFHTVDTSTEISRNQIGVFKELIDEAARIHEESWDAETKTYKRSIQEAADLAAGHSNLDELAYPIYLLLTLAWNDAINWAHAYPQHEPEMKGK